MGFDCMIKQLIEQYSSYFSIDNSEEIKQFEESVEENLTHLEEFCSILDLIRNEDIVCIEKLTPVIVAKAAQMEAIYRQIDKLEEFVKMVNTNVEQFKIEVNKAEEFFSNQSKLKKFFNSWLNNKKLSREKVKPIYQSPSIFRYDDLINRYNNVTKPSQFSNCDTSLSAITSHFSSNLTSNTSSTQPFL